MTPRWYPVDTAPTDDQQIEVCGKVSGGWRHMIVPGAFLAEARKRGTPDMLALPWVTHWRPMEHPEDETPTHRDPGVDAAPDWEKIARELLGALEEAVECGIVPTSSALEGGAAKYSRQVQVADNIRAAIARAKEAGL
ncbi:MAG: hypothetical protein ACEQSH_00280 [Bacteroidia bacterium]|jgi:hypothetical protein